jgi:hypothetical protein
VLAALATVGAGVDARAAEVQAACTCVAISPEDALDDADAALVGRVAGEREILLRGAPQKLYTIEVLQQVKGDLPDRLELRSPLGCDIDGAAVAAADDGSIGLLLTRSPSGVWLASACNVIAPEELVTVGGEPRGGVIKVVLGIAILALVLSWALRRKARGTRPRLPGAPEP